MNNGLGAFFAPRSVAVVGASDDPAKWGNIIARQSLRHVDRPTYFVNSRAATVLGRPAFRSIADIGQPVELAVVCVPVGVFRAVIDDVIASGVQAVLAITAGFAELGVEGEALQRSCAEALQAKGIRMIGPNCLGLADNGSGVFLAANDFTAGTVALLSQSGNLALELDALARSNRLGFSRFISIGNQADVTLVELMDACTSDPGTSALALYVEDFLDGRAFIAAAQRAHAVGKPVVVLASGSGPAATRSAGSHTGALSSNEAVVAMACDTAGAIRVRTPREMMVALQALRRSWPAPVRAVGVVTDGGGHGTLAAGLLEDASFSLPRPRPELTRLLRRRLWEASSVTNPVDLAGYGEQDPRSYAASTALMLADDAFDAVLVTGYFGGYSSPQPFAEGLAEGEVAAARAIVRACAKAQKSVVVHSMAEQSAALEVLMAAGIPVFAAIEDAVDALRLVGPRRARQVPAIPTAEAAFAETSYAALRELLRSAGAPSAPVIALTDQTDLGPALAGLAAPYVVKSLTASHKSDVDGVRIGLPDEEAVRAAVADLISRLGGSCAIETMVDLRGSVELLVGVKRDPRFGPVLMVGIGGTLTELLSDVQLACAPVDATEAERMLHALRAAPLLAAYRGRAALPVAAAAAAIARLSEVAAAHSEWSEFEVNPLALTPTGAHVLDARIVVG